MKSITETLELLAQFGRNIAQSPVVIPAFNNYFQDMNGGLAKIGNLTLLNGAPMFDHDNQEAVYPDFDFRWYADGVLKTETQNPIINEIKPDGYDGVFMVKLEITHKPTNTIYTREQWAFFDWNDEPNTLEGTLADPPAGEMPARWGVFYDFHPEGVQFGRLKYDFDGDGLVSTIDLLTFIGKEAERGITIKQASATKYDWTDVPKEVEYLTTDRYCKTEGWKTKPSSGKFYWDFGTEVFYGGDSVTPYTGDWKDSLEQRPA